MSSLLAITWTVEPTLIELGPLTIRWYGILFATAFFAGYHILWRIFKHEGVKRDLLETVLLYVMIGTVIGARLGHVFFYDWGYYSQHPSEIVMIWKGGLASHGAAIGILLALWLFSKKVSKKPMLWILDRVVITVASGGFFIRLGNLMNHEIIGHETDVPWAFIFTKHSTFYNVPTHPAQLYEALCYLVIFFVLMFLFWKKDAGKKTGFIFGLFLILLFSARFFVEFVKTSQGGFESAFGDVLSTGQLLSIPFILAGGWFLFRSLRPSNSAV